MILTIVFTYPTQNKILYGDLYNIKQSYYNKDISFENLTDENGKIVIDKLPVGKFYILEKEAPEGYKLNEEKMWFEIKEDGEVVKATMKDEQIIDVPDTEKNKDYKELIGGIALMLIGTGVVIYGIKRNKKNK